MTKRLKDSLSLSEEILSGLETETLSMSSAALRCLRLARLMNDDENIQWLQYECSGYPVTPDGHIDNLAFNIGCKHGRETEKNDQNHRMGNFHLANDIEASINSLMESQRNLTTQGVSVSGEFGLAAMNNLTTSLAMRSSSITKIIAESEHLLSILRGQYYNYALNVNLGLKFSQHAEDIFNSYRMQTDASLLRFTPDVLRKLNAAYSNLSSDNPESWSQSLSSCRRVFQKLSNSLYTYLTLGKNAKNYVTKSGKELDISKENYKNKMFAVVDFLSKSKTSRLLIGSEILLLIDWIEYMHDLLCKGVHEIDNPITYEEARSGVIRTYMLLGSLANLLLDFEE
ncbi:MAG: AbiTii domain-containing protein [Candidatus Hodarchaeales archaeon]